MQAWRAPTVDGRRNQVRSSKPSPDCPVSQRDDSPTEGNRRLANQRGAISASLQAEWRTGPDATMGDLLMHQDLLPAVDPTRLFRLQAEVKQHPGHPTGMWSPPPHTDNRGPLRWQPRCL